MGILIDSDLKFKSHIKHINSKCFSLIGSVFRVFRSLSPEIYLCFYCTYVLPVIDYGSPIYIHGYTSAIKDIEKVQRSFTRRLFRRLFPSQTIPSYESRLKSFKLTTLADRFVSTDLITVYKIINSFMIGPSFARYSPRVHYRLIIPSINTSLFRNSFFHNSLMSWNRMIKKSPPQSLRSFKNLVSPSVAQ